MRSILLCVMLSTGCAQIDTGGGGGSSGGSASSSSKPSSGDDGPDCGAQAGRILGVVSYNAPAGDPDGWPADGVEVLLNGGGPTYRVVTGPSGTFDLAVDPGQWAITPDVETGCGDGPEVIDVAACEVVELDLVIDLCAG